MTNLSEDTALDQTKRPAGLRSLILYFWSGRLLIGFTTLFFFLLAYLWVFLATPQYEATAVFAPTSSSSAATQPALSALASAARFVGIPTGTSGTTDFQKFQTLLTSDVLAQSLIDKHGVLQMIYANQWDAETKTWHAPRGIVPTISGIFARIFGGAPWAPPNASMLSAYLTANVVPTADASTGLVTVVYDYKDPVFARNLLVWMHDDADAILRQRARIDTQNRINYLNKTLPTVTVSDQRLALTQLLSTQDQTNMMIEADANYAAAMLDTASTTVYPVWPKPFIMIPAGIVVGLLFGMGLFMFLTEMDVEVPSVSRFRGTFSRLASRNS